MLLSLEMIFNVLKKIQQLEPLHKQQYHSHLNFYQKLYALCFA